MLSRRDNRFPQGNHKENLRDPQVKVAPEQERFVASNAVRRAGVLRSRRRVVSAFTQGYAVGFVRLHDDRRAEVLLMRFMVDHRYQKRGYGARALNQVIEYVRAARRARMLTASSRRGMPWLLLREAGLRYTGTSTKAST